MPKPKPTPAVCEWRDVGTYTYTYRTTCGEEHPAVDRDPIVRGFMVCPYCGKKLTVKA